VLVGWALVLVLVVWAPVLRSVRLAVRIRPAVRVRLAVRILLVGHIRLAV
jgi:hypothetical protein